MIRNNFIATLKFHVEDTYTVQMLKLFKLIAIITNKQTMTSQTIEFLFYFKTNEKIDISQYVVKSSNWDNRRTVRCFSSVTIPCASLKR